MDIIRVDTTMRADIVTALGNVNARAKRIPHVIGCEKVPSEWDRRHAQLDELLTDLGLLDAIEAD